jgi:hypothetical protein
MFLIHFFLVAHITGSRTYIYIGEYLRKKDIQRGNGGRGKGEQQQQPQQQQQQPTTNNGEWQKKRCRVQDGAGFRRKVLNLREKC